ncbi:hypothetical protein J4476_06100 [Candidatus Woesearchaeota archaeon]|nr:MAG: hypothetical protein QT09_C0016G0044 [archaeon GW2011_AR18]MBS3162240.1 hypothetical protein [Candidatus Woesearchaeota archaeon]HIH25569.1 hypothetical protein [Nanoarchaeota archaeon]
MFYNNKIQDITNHLIHPDVRSQVRDLFVNSFDLSDAAARGSVIDSWISNPRSLSTIGYVDDGKVIGFTIIGALGETEYETVETLLSCDRERVRDYLMENNNGVLAAPYSDDTNIDFSDRAFIAHNIIDLDSAFMKYVTVVSPEHRRKHIASQLNYKIRSMTKQPIFSFSIEDNPMIGINERAGYVKLVSVKPFYSDGKGAVLMVKA